MGMSIDDSIKQKLLDSLSEEPTMVLSTAYAYAKNYVRYGEDITKAWTTAVQQVSILEQVRQKAWVEAYDSFKKDYETRLNADMVAMLEELKEELRQMHEDFFETEHYDEAYGVSVSMDAIQQKIDLLKVESEVDNGNDD